MSVTKSAIEQVYDQLATIFGGTNPNQCFTMLMPGTNLNPSTYSYDTSKLKPDLVKRAESELVDQMFDIAKVQAGSNGQRLSSQYLQALSVLVPNFNPMMPVLKKDMRDFINSPVPEGALLDGKPYSGTIKDYYFALYEDWIKVKQDWEERIYKQKESLKLKDPATADEEFLEWYDLIAEGELARVDAAMGKLLATFSPSDMNAILGALASGPGGELDEAANMVHNLRMASPNGGYFYPVDLVPNDWFLDLKSDEDPVNLLKDPEFIAETLSVKRQGLMASISQVQAILNRMPSEEQVEVGAKELKTAQSEYSKAQSNLLNTFADNIVIAAEIYLSKNSDDKDTNDQKAAKVTEKAGKVKNNKKPSGTQKTTITAADVTNLMDGQKKLVEAQTKLHDSCQLVADKAMKVVGLEASRFPDLPVLLARLQSQLSEINDMRQQLVMSSSRPDSEQPILGESPSEFKALFINAAGAATGSGTAAAAKIVVKDLIASKALATSEGNAAADVAQALREELGKRIETKSQESPAPTAAELRTYITTNLKISATDDPINTAANGTSLTTAPAIATAVKAAIALEANKTAVRKVAAAKIPRFLPIWTTVEAFADTSTAKLLGDAIDAVVVPSSPHESKASKTSNRYMELKMSFTSSEMERSSSQTDSADQTSWNVSVFWGSASGSQSSASSEHKESAFDSSTEIQIAFKAAKIDIRRDWFNPGLFKISDDMSRLSSTKVADKPNKDNIFHTNNETILPAFPVAFVVAKDISISFKASTSSLEAVHSVLDRKSAIGGGIFCFSASHSSSSHSDSSKMSSKTQGNVITINIPGPQILGWFLELTPEDKSQKMDTTTRPTNNELTIVEYVKQIKSTQKAISGGN